MSGVRISPFKRGRVYWARVPRLDALAVQRSLGTEDARVAEEMCAFLRWLRGRRESFLLDALASGRVGVGPAYTAYVENRIERFIADLREGVTDVNIEPLVAKWQKELARRKKPNAASRAKYERQVRSLIVKDQPFPRSQFTKQRIRAWIGDLEVGQPNRYRAAMSSFAKFLVDEDVLTDNPVRHVKMTAEREPRSLHLSPADATRLCGLLAPKYAALHALMIATGMELGAALAIKRGDVDDINREAFARGTKRAHRQRTCTVYATWRPLWAKYVEPFLKGSLPASEPFGDVKPWEAYRVMKAALATAKLATDYRVHDHRHTWAVQAVRDGLALHTIAYQLGHRDATMVLKVYGRYQPKRSDFGISATASATAHIERTATE